MICGLKPRAIPFVFQVMAVKITKHIQLLLRLFLIVVLLPGWLSRQLYAQESPLDRKISISIQNKPLEEALNEISAVAGIHFSYSPKHIPVEHSVNLQINDAPLSKALDSLFTNLPVDYKLVEGQIILRKSTKRTEKIPEKKPENHTVSGYVREKGSGEALIGATIYIPDIEKGTVSNQYGFYSLTLPPGKYTLHTGFIGYTQESKSFELDNNYQFNFVLEENIETLEEIIITTSEAERIYQSTQMGAASLTPKNVQHIPTQAGQPDLIKSLGNIPGIKLFGDGSTYFHVRGGNKDQNLILLDEAPIFNPAHFLGLFSTFIPETVNDITIYKGDIPANYGGRLSSLVDVHTLEGNMQQWKFDGALGLISARASLQGPVIRDKSSVFLNLRKSHVAWILQRNDPESDLYFADFSGKFNYRFDDRNRFYLSFYAGEDFFLSDNSGITWGNTAGTLRWNFVLSERMFTNTTFSVSGYNYQFYTNYEEDNYWNSTINTANYKSDFTFYPVPDYTLKFGLQQTWYGFNPGNFNAGITEQQEYYPYVPSSRGSKFSLYVSAEQKPGSRLKIRYGVRIPTWRNLGESSVYYFDEQHQPVKKTDFADGERYNRHAFIEPRLGMSYQMNNRNALKFSYSRTSQFIQLITNSISPFTTLDIWLPSSPNIRPQQANQVSLGYYTTNKNQHHRFSTEGFFKRMSNQIDYNYHAEMLLNPLVEGELRFGKGRSYGVEFMYTYTFEKLSGWAGYTWSRAFLHIPEINGGRAYPAYYDRPHQWNIVLNYQWKPRLLLSATWNYSTGSAVTVPTGFYFYNGYQVPVYTAKNNERLPAYHRLDASLTWQLNRRENRFKHNLQFSIFNLYNRKNYLFVNFNKVEQEDGSLVIPTNRLPRNDYTASYFYLYSMVPSLTYNFAF